MVTAIRKNNGFVYQHEKHLFLANGNKKGTLYLKCYNENCSGTGKIKENEFFENVFLNILLSIFKI